VAPTFDSKTLFEARLFRAKLRSVNMEQGRILDTDQINELRQVDGGAGAIFSRLVDRFSSSLAERVDNIERCLAENRLPDLKIAAHSLKGAAGNLGAERLAGLCSRIELAAHGGDAALAKEACVALRVESDEARAALLREIGKTS
jgi:HPt (histidine-containing phosphotransfer) domain-containing protein